MPSPQTNRPKPMTRFQQYREAVKAVDDMQNCIPHDEEFLYSFHSHYDYFKCSAFRSGQAAPKAAKFQTNEQGTLICTDPSIYNDDELLKMKEHINQWLQS